MDSDTKAHVQATVDYLDKLMEKTPSRELADTSNYLQALLDKENANG